ncbi:MAG: beta-glucuronidase [Candidatus Pristimantibacillus lignocellulolyticus]|uniref:Beta-glucuronidase n=1 Tax=Candidatus Pristimantibacillus lignocellulolyticus TaxID=2994561 RepID=A0A9J6ZHI5_9BACL|nr:MAG: beta-glucuronidase [Candidatus Pristimantibacillus lignocellulolyticus]
MLYPQLTATRQLYSLDGFWRFAPDHLNDGVSNDWHKQLEADREISVQASWNEQYQDLMQYFGVGWYERDVMIPNSLKDERIWLRIGAANYLTTIWVNGELVGEHEGGHLPFEFDISKQIILGRANHISIRVDATIAADRLPPGDVESEMIIGFKGQFPNNYFDFFPYGGINRPVNIFSTPSSYVESIQLSTDLIDGIGKVSFKVGISGQSVASCLLQVEHTSISVNYSMQEEELTIVGDFDVSDVRPWCPADPYLYNMKVSLLDANGKVIDEYIQSFGIRSVKIEDTKLLLNGEPVFLNGFGMHEDFPVLGKGMNHAVIAKDFNLLKWMGANSIRTSHYPYSDEFLQYADRTGLLVIGETPFVGFVPSHYTDDVIREKAMRVISEMIDRDYNHPSIIAWSLANEGHTFVPEADPFYKALYDHARLLDSTRPITIVNCLDVEDDYALKHFDFVSLNRYYGWYEQAARLDEGCAMLDQKLDRCYELLRKPIIVTEFGADAVAGVHTDPPELFSEEYQSEMVTRQYQIIANKPYTIGAHVWSFADFKTSQTPSRVVVNRKGLFTRERQPKLAAHKLREIWLKEKGEKKT